ncbi:MAG: hypothetical protein WCV90_07510 [Candidatus Woesearchaeota archaeon]|jgi:hypothetical protein
MSKERIAEVREQLFQLERQIRPLEWDSSRNQINEFKKVRLGQLRVEHETLNKELSALESNPV